MTTQERGTTAVWKQEVAQEFLTPERCYIVETYATDEDSMSIARARVEPGVTTAWHLVEHTTERYIIAEGRGRVEVGDFPAVDVGPGDVVMIPSATRQRIANVGAVDLIFYCVCTPRFHSKNYRSLE
jgi:mannose-6-phosphate isomerase-like protein (cupin superfamily)